MGLPAGIFWAVAAGGVPVDLEETASPFCRVCVLLGKTETGRNWEKKPARVGRWMEGARTLQAKQKNPGPGPHFAPASPLPHSASLFPSSVPEPTRRGLGTRREALVERWVWNLRAGAKGFG